MVQALSCYSKRRRSIQPKFGLTQLFLEAQARSFAARLRADLDLVGDRTDDRDAEAAFRELLGRAFRLLRVEAFALVGHLDDEAVGAKLVRDLNDTGLFFPGVRVTHGVRRRLRQGELQGGEDLVGQVTDTCDPRQCEPTEGDVLGPRRNRQVDSRAVAVGRRAHALVRRHSSVLPNTTGPKLAKPTRRG